MKWHKVEEQLLKNIRDIELELTAMGPEERNQYNENREMLASELELLKSLAKQITDWSLDRARAAVQKMQKMRDSRRTQD